jgi:flagellar protein FlaG
MMLITGVVAASILIVAVLPIVWSMVGTFSTASRDTDTRMRTDFKIVTTYAKYIASPPSPAGTNVTVWMKNIGTAKIGIADLKSADVYVGKNTDFGRASWSSVPVLRGNLQWWYTLSDLNVNSYWDPGETLQVDTFCISAIGSAQPIYFQFTLPSSVSRSLEFTSV